MNLNLQLTKEQQDQLEKLAAAFHKELEDRTTPPFPTAKTLSDLKQHLFAALSKQAGFADPWGKAKTTAQLLCLSHEKTAIRNLPWQIATEERELLTIAKSFQQTLAPHQPSGYPLKVLVMVASPEGVTRLAYEEEELKLLQAFSPLMSQGLVQVHFTDDGSLENLKEKLEENKYHILHFTGHGSYSKGQGSLALEDPISGRLKEATAEAFNQVLAEVTPMGHRPDLVVLSACQTAQGVGAGDLSGIADTLLHGEIPAAIAMSASILDTCATIFAATLYTELSKGHPLFSSFQTARLAVKHFETLTYQPAQAGYAPGQWLIPQLLLNEAVAELVDKNSPKETLDFKNDVKIIRGEQALVDLRVRPKNYVFVGRRKEKRIALQQLKAGKSILLRGQGGVGKTALAEHLAIRLLAGNQRNKVFTFSEKKPAAQSLLDQMKTYLTKDKKYFKVVSEIQLIDKQIDQFYHLLGKVSEHCDPVFLFDNIESFQQFDEEQSAWVWQQDKHEDVFQVLQILDQQTSFSLIITGRYPITEFPDLEICNMNTVPFSDFFRKCHQLEFSSLAQKMQSDTLPNELTKRTEGDRVLTFEEVVKLLHKTFGGNYRALEFFNELYTQKGDEIFQTLGKLSEFESDLSEKQIKEGVLTQMSENLILEELLSYLNEDDKDTLFVLAQFNIPVLPMAIGMQRNSEDRSAALGKMVNLTLAERQTGVDVRERYYVMPLIKDWLKTSTGLTIPFDEKIAGDYHKYIYDNDLEEDWVVELSETFERYFSAKAVTEINDIGDRLCDFYYDIQQFRIALSYGLRTEEIAKEKTEGRIYSFLGSILQIFGQLDLSLSYKEKSLKYFQKKSNRKAEGATLNNISQIYDAKGQYDEALNFLQLSLKIKQEIGDRKGEGTALNNISQIHKVRGQYDEALKFLQLSLKIQQEIGDRKGEGTTLNNLATTAHAKGQYDEALKFLQLSLKIRQEIGDRKGESTSIGNIARIYQDQGKLDLALEYFKQDLNICQAIGDIHGMAITQLNMGVLFFQQENIEEAIPYLFESYQTFEKIGSPLKENTEGYLNAIIEKIGQEKFQAILNNINQNQ